MGARKVRPSKPTLLEWVGGHFPIPGVVTDEAEPYHVELLIWVEFPSGLIVGHDMVHAGQLAGAYGRSLRDAMKKPLAGSPRRPDRVRVGTEAAAVEVRGVVGPGTEVVVEATHEIDAIAADFQAHAQRSLQPADEDEEHRAGDFTSGSYLQGGLVAPESIEELFRGAVILNAMPPWRLLRDRQILRLDIPDLDVHGAALLVLWKEVRRRGFVIFPDSESFFAMADHAEQFGHDAPDVPGTPMLSLLFTKAEDLPEPARQEIERFGWSGVKSEFPWVDLRDRDGNLVPVDQRNIEIVSAVAWTLGTFCMKNEAALTGEWEDAASMTIESDHRATVRYTIPYAAYEEFESEADPEHRPRRPSRAAARRAPSRQVEVSRSEPPPSPRRGGQPRKVGRNEPCPCGSGRKYKHCHLEADEAAAAPHGAAAAFGPAAPHGSGAAFGPAAPRGVAGTFTPAAYASGQPAGVQLVEAMRAFAPDHFGSRWQRHTRDFHDAAATLQLAREWSVFHFEVEGETAAVAYAAKEGARLTNVEKQWLTAQQQAWLSVWEVQSVQRGRDFTARDLLSGEVRRVHDVSVSESAKPRDALLARVVHWGNRDDLWGLHPRPLPPLAASHVIDAARKRLRLGAQGLAPLQVLRAEATGRFLISQWEHAVERMDAEIRNPPRFATTDGETLVQCSVVYDFDPAERAKIAAALAALPNTEPPDADEMRAGQEWTYTFSKAEPSSNASASVEKRRTILGEARLGKSELRLETNSRERCERLTGWLSKAAGPLLRERERSEVDVREEYMKKVRDPAALAQARGPKPQAVPPPEVIAMAQALKLEHYRGWLDETIPALGGKTPRQAARLVRGRRQLDVLLRDMENTESRLPEWDRYDFSKLRAELGLDP